jgi:hypothetical protein
LCFPAWQFWQTLAAAEEKVAFGQSEQALCPVEEAYFPSEQSVHEAALPRLNFPGSQSEQVLAPAEAAYFPDSQEVQLLGLNDSSYFALSQLRQATLVSVAAYVPGPQSMHAVALAPE